MGLYSVIGFVGVFVSLCTTSRVYTPLCHNNQVTCTRLSYLSRKWLYHHIVSMFVLFGKSVENQVKSRLSGCWYCLFESRFNTFSSWRLGCVLEREISITVDKEVKKTWCWFSMLKVCFNWNLHLFSAGVSSGSVDEPLEPGGDGEERPWELSHPLTADHQKDQRGERTQGKENTLPALCCSPVSPAFTCVCSGSGGVSVWAGGSARNHVLVHAASGTNVSTV